MIQERGTRTVLETATKRYFYRCACGQRLVRELRWERARESLPLASGQIVMGKQSRLFDALGQETGPDARCPECHGFMVGHELMGVYAPEVECNDSCRMATGADCRCACGGAHHGEGWL